MVDPLSGVPSDKDRRIGEAWDVLRGVADPEIPVISVVDLGLVRDVHFEQGDWLGVTVTPTYSGCPATEVIADSIRQALAKAGFSDPTVRTLLSPAWTTDWLSSAGREKLLAYGIAPPIGCAAPEEKVIELSQLRLRESSASPRPACPQCGSNATEQISAFGSTPCKALYRCTACCEPFDYFKCH
ncbi:MAG: phenylacetate-CoA oxygenase subunit PaaJ [Xanthomonadales bacterium]|nr:phenylacetate-CoA oxygenase subunit PaaJ [Xanthomonadales bacterium]